MAKKRLELQWRALGEGVLADWRGALDEKQGVRLEQVSTGKGWGPWHLRKGETLVAADTLRARSLVKEAAKAGDYKDVPLAVLEALESFAASALLGGEKGRAGGQGWEADMSAPARAPELRVLLPAFEQLGSGEYVLDAPGSPVASWKVRVSNVGERTARLELVEPGPDLPIPHGPFAFDAEGGTLMGVGDGCYCGGPAPSPGAAHGHVLTALALVESALTAAPEGMPVAEPPKPALERQRIAGVPFEQAKGELLRRWLQVAHLVGEGGKVSEAIEPLPVPLTPAARLVKADLLTATYEADAALDLEEKQLKDALKRRREVVEKRRQKLVDEIQSRQELRDIRTLEVVVYPLREVWRVRTDTYEVVSRRAMDLGDQAARVYAEDDTSAPFHSPAPARDSDGDGDEDDGAEPAPRARKKRAPSVSLSLATGEALGLEEPEEQRRKATPDATSDMTVTAPVKHRCQRGRCGHSEADHSGSSGQCMASIRTERDGQPGETCSCTAYVPPPSARAPEPTTSPEQAPAVAPPSADDLPPATGEAVESLPAGWMAQERGTGWWLSHVDVEAPVGPFFPFMDGAGRFAYLEPARGREDLDAWMPLHEDVLNALEAELSKGAASFAVHYPLADAEPGWLLAASSGTGGGPVKLHLVRGVESSPALTWHWSSESLDVLAAVAPEHVDAEVEAGVEWMAAHAEAVKSAEAVIKRGDVRELPQPAEGMVMQ